MVNPNDFKMKLEKILYWMFFVFLLWVIFELIKKILGGSLKFEELITTLVVINIGYSFYLTKMVGGIDKKLSGHIGWHKGRDRK